MNNTLIKIMYRDGKEERDYIYSYRIAKGCLVLYKRFRDTRYIPLDTIKEWRVYD